jgi:hypothetical protein
MSTVTFRSSCSAELGNVALHEPVLGRRGCLFADGRIHRLDGDRAAAVTGEGLQLAKHDVGGTGGHIELHRIAVRPPGRSGEHDQVGDAGVREKHLDEVLSQIVRTDQADMKVHRNFTPSSSRPWSRRLPGDIAA